MEIIIILLALFSQLLGLCGFVFSCFLFLKFSKIKGWFNKKAGTKIVSFFSFRPFRTLIITGLLGFVMMIVGLLCSVWLWGDGTSAETQLYWLVGICVALTLVYPAWRVVRRILHCSRAENKKAERWRLFYDVVINWAGLCGGLLLLVVLSFVAVILSFTKWSNFVPSRLYEMVGMDIVPESKTYYWVGAVLGVVAVFSQWFGPDGEDVIGYMVGISVLAFIGYAWYQVRNATPEDRKRLAWRWGYMILTTYAVFTITWILIFVAIALLILYIVLAATGNAGGGGKDKYKVTCDNLTDDVINGRGICKITNSRCKMRDTGVCPYD
ncbi:hypothetical protein [uncultured Bacteroides sp.]|jgi:hypothetical protein|uniref:hypothetical protein n=1 Tax=uncultured Bacteroides sp. TaxID=162156 RepID=UPI00280BB096|nr:hypothetical protein [uncultured Bacteroides sp.]